MKNPLQSTTRPFNASQGNSSIKIKSAYGPVNVAGVAGDFHGETLSGNLALSNLDGSLFVTTRGNSNLNLLYQFIFNGSSYAFVNEDGTLRIKRKTIHLYGIHIPETGNHCRTNISPTVCGSRAALALDFKIQSFVRCEIMEENDDGSLVGWCRVGASKFDTGTDLSAYLLERGWAVALPDAPIEYQALEKIARSRQIGYWGIPIDRAGR